MQAKIENLAVLGQALGLVSQNSVVIYDLAFSAVYSVFQLFLDIACTLSGNSFGMMWLQRDLVVVILK